ncbi:biliverdin-producing heme oxygenase [Pseudomonas mangiferae]|uniref:Biliverdin-producing heme oxygenase n=1 Tax=Pseudomonas mangiferae TaxID=2593654 RepID=A0A553GUP3_9PSED|nr:biliverdin-producing heme oxygenase [Pseudomonas mangiferae]TRX73222.1 biliverdin-producing heme oxygenase [Pseudomonas mangiferae]
MTAGFQISPVLFALRDATRQLHAELDATSPLIQPNLDEARYVRYVRQVLGWMRPLEAGLARLQWPVELEAPQRFAKSRWLEADLLAAGLDREDLAAIADCPDAPQATDLASGFGIAYVVEGATLGGAILYKRLSPRLPGLPLEWLRGYGGDTGVRWQRFQQQLARHVLSEADIRLAQRSAQEAFRSFRHWVTPEIEVACPI